MTDKYFDEMKKERPLHPRVRAWMSYRRRPEVVGVRVVFMDRDGPFDTGPTRMFVEFHDAQGEIVQSDECAWEFDLERWLVSSAKARAVELPMEVLRFSLIMKHFLRKAIRVGGDGYFNAVFLNVAASDFDWHPEVADVLRSVHRGQAAPGQARDHVVELVEGAFKRTAELIAELYDPNDPGNYARLLLGGAVARFIDDRFHISTRRELGWG
jgi:hypothetical protein